MRKIAVILIAIMTLGMYVPSTFNAEAEEGKDAFSSKSDFSERVPTPVLEVREEDEIDFSPDLSEPDEDYFINEITEKAKEQTITKLGPRIASQVNEDFMDTILLHMEEVVQTIFAEGGQDAFQYYGVTERPSSGFGEKIFNIYDVRTNKDIARFHVRRDNRPKEGYWFNFHYHLSNDGFEEHHEIGEIYWDKNIPPKWMA